MPPDPAAPRSGRYTGSAIATYVHADRRTVVYLARRFVPQPESHTLIQEHLVCAGERLDLVANKHFGDPLLFWRLCDASRGTDPLLLETPGRRLRITLPVELSDQTGEPGA